ncbi:MAG TPA: hypothetical protein VE959_11670 [Bryobacteraceae bacterium]|nr:hypothetical protein [Bryobacteraceae bacterium]
MRDDSERLWDILEAIDQIVAKTGEERAEFDANEMLQVLGASHLQIIGEASRCLSESFRQTHPDPVRANREAQYTGFSRRPRELRGEIQREAFD